MTVLRPVDPDQEDFVSEPIFDRIKREISENPVMVYMKGTPEFPQCGFSGATVRIFELLKTPIASRNVLEDPELRDGIKRFSNWPTIPQVYIGGTFIGGSDIMREMYQSGELAELVKKTLEG
jgi:monothiol glutaredoxin